MGQRTNMQQMTKRMRSGPPAQQHTHKKSPAQAEPHARRSHACLWDWSARFIPSLTLSPQSMHVLFASFFLISRTSSVRFSAAFAAALLMATAVKWEGWGVGGCGGVNRRVERRRYNGEWRMRSVVRCEKQDNM